MIKHSYAFVDDNFRDFRSHHIKVRVAKTSWEKQNYFSLRKKVFSKEQKILIGNEQDSQDFRSIPIIALASYCGVSSDVVGAVRIYRVENDRHDDKRQIWFGGRLCVDRKYRGIPSIGKSLVNEAVLRAKYAGCTVFLANVQPRNEAYFHSLHWTTQEHIEVAGHPHIRMQADLNAYPLVQRYYE